MKRTKIAGALAAVLVASAFGQQNPAESKSVPLYQVTVVERSVPAVNYQYRSGPTKIDFRGTVLLSYAKGEATVESRRGRTEIDAKFDSLAAPTRFGREYLTYVLWAISPDGAPHNLGELVPDASNHAHSHVTTDLQVFGMIVTAEPYAAVRQPSDVVVLENQVRPDTVGQTRPIEAKYELMPRGHYTYQIPEALTNAVSKAPKVSMDQYEAILEVYQAQNAVGIARSAGAEQYAPNTFAKAQKSLEEAQRLQSAKAGTSLIVQNAREASEAAEDARAIAERRKSEEQVAKVQNELAAAQRAKEQAEAAAQQARAEAAAARADLEAERIARERAIVESRAARAEQAQADRIQPSPAPTAGSKPSSTQAGQSELRVRLLEQLNGVLSTRDTPRGLVVTVPDASFSGAALRPEMSGTISRIAAILATQPGLRVQVQGYSDSAAGQDLAAQRAAVVRSALVGAGLAATSVSSEGLGNTRPVESNATEAGRLANRRVEIVITGEPIGALPYWDKPYSVAPR